jgi:hypothetical protein
LGRAPIQWALKGLVISLKTPECPGANAQTALRGR